LQTGESLIYFHGLGGVSMAEVKIRIECKRIFIVDDEPDILKNLGELFSMGDVTKGSNFEGARALLGKKHFDMAILDIIMLLYRFL
jgi:hypothetical protein